MDVKVLALAMEHTDKAVIEAGAYTLPAGGLPRGDLAYDVQQALNKAESALQPVHNTANDAHKAQFDKVNARIDGVENLGQMAGSFETFALLRTDTAYYVNGITINDFVTVQVDETHDGKATRYVAIDITNDVITWQYDFTYSTDVSGKTDKVPSATAGNLAALDVTGNLTDSGKKADDFATAAQGALADSAQPKITATGNTNLLVAPNTVGGQPTTKPVSDFSTAAQGEAAETALQEIEEHIEDTDSHIQAGERETWNAALQEEVDPVYSADKSSLALKTELPTNVSQLQNDSGYATGSQVTDAAGNAENNAKAYTNTKLTDYLTEEETNQLLQEHLQTVLIDKGSKPSRVNLPVTADNYDSYLLEDEELIVFAYNKSIGLSWLPLNFFVDMSLYETVQGATEKMNAAVQTANAHADTVASGKLGINATAADSALLNGMSSSAFATASQGTKADTAYQKPPTGIPTNDIAENSVTDVKIGNRTLEDSAGSGTLITIAAKTLTAWLQGLRNNIRWLFENKAPASAALTADTGTGTDVTTPAVSSTTVESILQAIWAKIRQVANAKQDKLTATGTTNLLTAPASAGGQSGTKAISDFLASPAAQTADTQLLLAPATKGNAPTLKAVSDFATAAQGGKADGAVQSTALLATEPTSSSTDAQITSAKRLWTMMGAALSTLQTTAKTIVGAINELKSNKLDTTAQAANSAKLGGNLPSHFFSLDNKPMLPYIPRSGQKEATNRITANNGTWTVDRDGFVYCSLKATGAVRVNINNEEFFHSGVSGSALLGVIQGDDVQMITEGAISQGWGCYYVPPIAAVTTLNIGLNYPVE